MKTLTALSTDTALPIPQTIWTLIGNTAESPYTSPYQNIPPCPSVLPDPPASINTWKYRGRDRDVRLSKAINPSLPQSSGSITRNGTQTANAITTSATSGKSWGLWALAGMVAVCLSGCACPECCGAHKSGTHKAHQSEDKGMDSGTDKGKYGSQKLHRKGSARAEPSHETKTPPRTSPSPEPYLFRPGFR